MIDGLRVDRSIRCTRSLKLFDFRYLPILSFREMLLMSVRLRVFRVFFLRIISSEINSFLHWIRNSASSWRIWIGGVRQSHLSITEDLRRTLSYQSGPEESGAVRDRVGLA